MEYMWRDAQRGGGTKKEDESNVLEGGKRKKGQRTAEGGEECQGGTVGGRVKGEKKVSTRRQKYICLSWDRKKTAQQKRKNPRARGRKAGNEGRETFSRSKEGIGMPLSFRRIVHFEC